MATRTLAVMFTDIKGFTSRTSEATRNGLAHLLDRHSRLLVPVFRYFEGTVVKTIGDAFLVHFESPTDAVLCGVTIQEVLRRHNSAAAEKDRLEVRLAINVGEVEIIEKDILGEAVNIASRLQGIAEAGEVFFTDAVYQTMNRSEAPSAEVGERIFKGIPHPIRVYKVIDDPNSTLRKTLTQGVKLSDKGPILKGLRPGTKRRKIASIGKGALAGAAVLAILVWALLPFIRQWRTESTTQRVTESSLRLIEKGAYVDALKNLHAQLTSNPSSEELVSNAIRAARGQVDALSRTGDYQKALDWLREETRQKTYLAILLPEMAQLDAKATVTAVLNDPKAEGLFYPQALKELVARYPQNADVPYTAARTLQERTSSITALWLFGLALERGRYSGDEHIFSFCTKALSEGRIDYERFRRADAILRQFYRERRYRWAQQILDTGGALALRNAWVVLRDEKDPRIEDRYYLAVHNLVEDGEDDMKAAYEVFRAQTDPARRKHILALHEEIVSTYPKFTVSRNKREAIQSNLEKLTATWKLE